MVRYETREGETGKDKTKGPIWVDGKNCDHRGQGKVLSERVWKGRGTERYEEREVEDRS